MRAFLFSVLLFILIVSGFCQEVMHECAESKIAHYKEFLARSPLSYPGDGNIDVTYYGLDLRITHTPQYISGNVIINATIVSQGIQYVYIDLRNELQVDSVKLNNLSVPFIHGTASSNQTIRITLDQIYAPGSPIVMQIFYRGIPGTSGFGSFEFGSHNGDPIIWTLSEPFGALDWWPCKDTPADKADSADIRVTADAFFTVVSNGKLISVSDNIDGTKSWHWKSTYPIAQYLISLAMTNYAIYQQQFEYAPGQYMPVTHYNYPERLSSSREAQLSETTQMLQVYSEKFGPYPFLNEKYGHAEFGWGGGMEHQTVTSMGSFGRSIISHELAHQWYGDKVTCRTWGHIWLNEGFATYAEAVYTEAISGFSAYQSQMNSEMNYAKSAQGSIFISNVDPNDPNSVWDIFDSARSYSKGAVVLHMLRGIVGDENFFQIMREYADAPGLAYGVATTEDFQQIAESVSGVPLNYFFQEWIYGENYPRYSYSWWSSNNGDGNYTVRLNVSQQTNTNPSIFSMPIQIGITTQAIDTVITVFNNKRGQQYNLVVNGRPLEVVLDPENWILKSILSATTLDGEGNPVSGFLLSANYPNPFNPETTILYNLDTSGVTNLVIYNSLGQKIRTLVSGLQISGQHFTKWDGKTDNRIMAPSGVYYYKLTQGNRTQTRKMILLR